jgi:hypothetical protein
MAGIGKEAVHRERRSEARKNREQHEKRDTCADQSDVVAAGANNGVP